jgi:hypothetical protein
MTSTDELEARIEALEAQQAVQTDALRYLVEGRWTGDLPHAAAEISALYGPDGPGPDFAPVEYPPKA